MAFLHVSCTLTKTHEYQDLRICKSLYPKQQGSTPHHIKIGFIEGEQDSIVLNRSPNTRHSGKNLLGYLQSSSTSLIDFPWIFKQSFRFFLLVILWLFNSKKDCSCNLFYSFSYYQAPISKNIFIIIFFQNESSYFINHKVTAQFNIFEYIGNDL